MKRLMMALLVLALAIGSTALAENHSAKLLGIWEADMGDEGTMTMNMSANGFGTYSQNGQMLAEFALAVRGNTMVSAMIAEDGTVIFGAEEFAFVVIDESNMLVTEVATGESAQFVREPDVEKAA